MNEYTHQLDIQKLLRTYARFVSDSLDTLLPLDMEFTHRCTGGKIDHDKDDFLVKIRTYRKGEIDPVIIVEYDTRKLEVKITSPVLDAEKIKEKLSIDRL